MYRITFVLGGEKAYRQRAMRILLATLTMVDRAYIEEYEGTDTPAPHPKELSYEEEPLDVDDWLDASALVRMGSADCEDLACYVAAWLQAKRGLMAWPKVIEDAHGDSHTVVALPGGKTIDPSLFLGREAHPGEKHACTCLGKNSPTQRITIVTDLFKNKTKIAQKNSATLMDAPQELSHRTLTLLLHALFLIDCLYLMTHPDAPPIYQAGVHYEEEPPGREEWQDIPSTVLIGNGDCEDLATWCAAQYVVRQRLQARPTFVWRLRPSGAYLYHIQTTLPDGSVEDPSRVLGMGKNLKVTPYENRLRTSA